MVKFDPELIKKPDELTDEIVAKKTEQFKANPKAEVWKEEYIKKALKKMSHNKCCYCECKLGEESKYMTVDHYHPKCKFPEKVVEWKNLLPSCSRCNSKKGSHDTEAEPIINPRDDDPRKHLMLSAFIYEDHSKKGYTTIELLSLNDMNACLPRCDIFRTTTDSLRIHYNNAQNLVENNNSTIAPLPLRNGVKKLLEEAQPTSEYSAIVATTILEHPKWASLVAHMEKLGLWDDEMKDLHKGAINIALPWVPAEPPAL